MKGWLRCLALLGALGTLLVLGSTLVSAEVPGEINVSFVAPKQGSTIKGSTVHVQLKIDNFATVDAGSRVRPGEGHVDIFIDREPIGPGKVVPSGQPSILHLGRAPYDKGQLQLEPGSHTLQAVLTDSQENVYARELVIGATFPPAKTSFTVVFVGRLPGGGDGSLAEDGAGLGVVAAVILAALALVTRWLTRR